MVPWYGYRPASSTVYLYFNSFAAATGASSATSNFVAGDVLIYKDGSDTQRTSANGITVTTSFDSQTGLQLIAIDLSDNTDAGFYAAGHHYGVAVADITIDTQTVRFWVGSFDIGPAQVNVTQFGGSAGTFASGVPEVNTTKIAGSAVSTTTAQIGTNIVKVAGTTVNGAGTAGNPWGP